MQTEVITAGSSTQVLGKGTVKLRAELPEIINVISLSNTLLVPSLSVNLISQSKLEQHFYTNTKEGYQVRDRESDDLIFDAR